VSAQAIPPKQYGFIIAYFSGNDSRKKEKTAEYRRKIPYSAGEWLF
jgi:hypothetical protein